MLFSDIIGDLLGNACMVFFGVIFVVGWGVSALFKSAAVRDAAETGFWAWFLSDDD